MTGARRQSAKRDANEREIITALERLGCLVQQISEAGVPDLMVWSPFLSKIILMEVKDGSKPPSARKLKPEQVEFHGLWKAVQAPVFVVTSIHEAVAVAKTCQMP